MFNEPCFPPICSRFHEDALFGSIYVSNTYNLFGIISTSIGNNFRGAHLSMYPTRREQATYMTDVAATGPKDGNYLLHPKCYRRVIRRQLDIFFRFHFRWCYKPRVAIQSKTTALVCHKQHHPHRLVRDWQILTTGSCALQQQKHAASSFHRWQNKKQPRGKGETRLDRPTLSRTQKNTRSLLDYWW
jgi:hypothetical protein